MHQCGMISVFIESKFEEDNEISSAELERLVARMFSAQLKCINDQKIHKDDAEVDSCAHQIGMYDIQAEQNQARDFAKTCTCIQQCMHMSLAWTDESSVQLRNTSLLNNVSQGGEIECEFKPAPKHALKCMFCLGFQYVCMGELT